MTTSLRCVPPPLPVSATYRQEASPHGATLTSSQLFTLAPVMRTVPSTDPAGSSATTAGALESLSDQSTSLVRRLRARPLASDSAGNVVVATVLQASSSAEEVAERTGGVMACRALDIENHTTHAASANSPARKAI